MDVYDDYDDYPGGDGYVDVTELFDKAAQDIGEGETILAESFTLMDAMSAFEIGEPRMDSGMILEQELKPVFNPLSPLLPEEVCWVIDRSFTCEMLWHSGYTLSQTVYTWVHVHHIKELDPDLLVQDYHLLDPARPMGLVTIVLRGALYGMLKCCDLSWRELSKGNVSDTVDWQGEKAEVSLAEGTPSEYVAQLLDDACLWVRSTVGMRFKDALYDRLQLRKALLDLYKLNIHQRLNDLRPLIVIARNALRRIRTHPPMPEPVAGSAASWVFDKYITRRLHSFIPTRVLDLPPQDVTWDALEVMLQGWEELNELLHATTLSAWEVSGSIRACSSNLPLLQPYIRSLTQTQFFERNQFLNQHPAIWVLERYCLENLGWRYDRLKQTIQTSWVGSGTFSMKDTEKHAIKILSTHIRSYHQNPPRRRRTLIKSIIQWEILHTSLKHLMTEVFTENVKTRVVLDVLPILPRLSQYSVALDIVLSGFQQELYSADERPVAYWSAVELINLQLDAINTLKPAVDPHSIASFEIDFQRSYLETLRALFREMCIILATSSKAAAHLSTERSELNYHRRYKWLFSASSFPTNSSDQVKERIIPVPGFDQFAVAVEEYGKADFEERSQALKRSKETLLRLASQNTTHFWAPKQAHAKLAFIRDMASACDDVAAITTASQSQAESPTGFDTRTLVWDPAVHPWFPRLAHST